MSNERKSRLVFEPIKDSTDVHIRTPIDEYTSDAERNLDGMRIPVEAQYLIMERLAALGEEDLSRARILMRKDGMVHFEFTNPHNETEVEWNGKNFVPVTLVIPSA